MMPWYHGHISTVLCKPGIRGLLSIDWLLVFTCPQDASTASLVWMLTQMAEHPDVLAKVCVGVCVGGGDGVGMGGWGWANMLAAGAHGVY